MIFTELRFLYFLAVVLCVSFLLRSNPLRKAWLLAASYAFYAAWDWRFLSLIILPPYNISSPSFSSFPALSLPVSFHLSLGRSYFKRGQITQVIIINIIHHSSTSSSSSSSSST